MFNKFFSRGFTLIELLVVIAIIGILASVVTVSTSSAKKQSRDVKRKADLETTAGALEIYYSQEKEYPASLDLLRPDYLTQIPTDPKTNTAYTYSVNDTKSKFYLDSQLERKEDPTIDISTNAFQTGAYLGGDGLTHYRVASP
jgi:prepilin-type N-terminal cleavage/methylation domain-containing protein